MRHIRVLICRVDDPATDHMTELAAFDLPPPDVATFDSTTTLDDLETATQQTGNAILRRVLQAQWVQRWRLSTASAVSGSLSRPTGTSPSPSPAASAS